MGHTIDEWRGRVARNLRDEASVDANLVALDDGLRSAFAEFSSFHPRDVVVQVAGEGSGYFDLPMGWEAWSELTGVEYPAGRNPPVELTPAYWRMTRSVDDVDVEQILLNGLSPAASEYVRFTFTGSWPFPDATDPDVDLLDDRQFESVSALAAAYVCESLANQAARGRDGAIPSDLVAGEDRRLMLSQAALALREQSRLLVDTFWGVV